MLLRLLRNGTITSSRRSITRNWFVRTFASHDGCPRLPIIIKRQHEPTLALSCKFSQFPVLRCRSDVLAYEKACDETLDSLAEYFEELIDRSAHLKDADVTYGDGVLTVKFGDPYGTYVINRQTPNQQIWLSSPFSGPKRYDYLGGQWVYRHDGITLHELLDQEVQRIVKYTVDFRRCQHSRPTSR
ncbi:frataxin, mitochondrial [Ischnura elegans]|uniref:frataxin, mitochondrial n=1 Tax=Ischnura elegans TaxID=197161 RepID=UPI001ED8A11D|nr:frataxin, mitochondrial [Ischnura elegans]